MRPDNRFILLVLVFAALAVTGYRQHQHYAEWRNFVTVCVKASQGRSDSDGLLRQMHGGPPMSRLALT